MKKIRLFLTGLLLVVTAAAYAQDITVTGTVTDASTGEGIAGATITQEIPVNGRSTVDVSMEIEAEMLDDVIVVGYGSATKISSVVGSASTVNKKVLANRPTANAGDALQGQVSGLQVYSSSGEPSASVSMRLRGVNSINSSSTPLLQQHSSVHSGRSTRVFRCVHYIEQQRH